MLDRNPLELVTVPKKNRPRLRFEPLDVCHEIVDAREEPYRTTSGFIHATGAETGAVVRIFPRDIDVERMRAHIPGSKAIMRNRYDVVIEEWAKSYLEWHLARHDVITTPRVEPIDYARTPIFFEAEVVLRWLESLKPADREIEVQIALAPPAFATLAKIGNKEIFDAKKTRRRTSIAELKRVRESASDAEVMKRTQKRSTHESWTWRDTMTLTNDSMEYHEVFGHLSQLGHPPSALVMRNAPAVTINELETEALKSRKRLRSLSVHAEPMLGITLSARLDEGKDRSSDFALERRQEYGRYYDFIESRKKARLFAKSI